jgi:hypothetical protein
VIGSGRSEDDEQDIESRVGSELRLPTAEREKRSRARA